ncbi:MFS general substrate transporter [Thozetella sp. PMI_491]|nr:MFS general substrate transporter [Thozetella sp. PMI_491]
MADHTDQEKEVPVGDTKTAPTADNSSTEEEPQGAETLKETLSRRSGRGRSHSASSDDSDPLSPLEHALTPDLRVENDFVTRELSLARTTTSIGSCASRLPDFEVTFEPDDQDNPKNWPKWYRAWVIFCVSYSTWTVVLYSTSYTSSIPGLMAEFGVESTTVATLGVTSYLFGLAAGSVVVAPMSELYGRRPVYLIGTFIFTVLVIPCALGTSLTEIIIVRFFGAFFASVMVSNSPGTIVDITEPDYLALVMSCWSIAPLNGPVTGPLIGGFVYQYLGWRWDNWLVLILGGMAFICMVTVKETYAPAILQKKAALRRKETDDERWWSRYDQKFSTVELLKLNLSRPFILSLTEPILWFFNIWISIIYGILYLCFVAYPIVFSQHRGWGPGISGLAFVGIGVGSTIAIVMEPVWRKIINSHEKDPETGRAFPEATASVMMIGAISTAVGQLVFSWTCLPVTIHWAVPIAFGIPFGLGNTLSFIYGSNYLAGSYGIYAASALAGNAVMRSFFGGTLPLAGPAMYQKLTPQWAGTFLGLLETMLIAVPFVFYRYGAKIRAKSRVIQQMREEQAKDQSRRARQAARLARKAEKRAAAGGETKEGVMVGTPAVSGATQAERDVEKGAA